MTYPLPATAPQAAAIKALSRDSGGGDNNAAASSGDAGTAGAGEGAHQRMRVMTAAAGEGAAAAAAGTDFDVPGGVNPLVGWNSSSIGSGPEYHGPARQLPGL